MGKVLSFLVVFLAILVGVSIYLCPCLLKDPKVPTIPSHRWWGPGQEPSEASKKADDIRPFRIQVPDDDLQDLKRRLSNTRLSDPLEGATFQYGFNTHFLKKILDHWIHQYEWRKEEDKLNKWPQFLVKIEGIDVHFIRAKPSVDDKKVKVLPLLLIHGWPGSVVEFYKIIPLLTSGVNGVAFEVICPSIPGYGFSEAPHHPGYSSVDAGRTFKKLMELLGHDQFYVQGGDWGSNIGSMMATFYPEKVRGLHLNLAVMDIRSAMPLLKYIVGHLAPSLIMEENQTFNIFPFNKYFSNVILESGYFHIQATKPDTIGVALGDSPVGLAAYILEKFSTGTNGDNRDLPDGGIMHKFDIDDLLTNVMVYWFTNTATSSARLYKEYMKSSQQKLKLDSLPIFVPSGIAIFPHEIMTVPRSILSHKFRQILTYNFMESGGHFAALEEPQLLAEDIRVFVTACESHYKEQESKSKGASDSQSKPKAKAAPVKNKNQGKTTPVRTGAKEEKPSIQEPTIVRDQVKSNSPKVDPNVAKQPSQTPDKLKDQLETAPETRSSTTEPKGKRQEEVKVTIDKGNKKQDAKTTKANDNAGKATTPLPDKVQDKPSTTTKTTATKTQPNPTPQATLKQKTESKKLQDQHTTKSVPEKEPKVERETVPEVSQQKRKTEGVPIEKTKEAEHSKSSPNKEK